MNEKYFKLNCTSSLTNIGSFLQPIVSAVICCRFVQYCIVFFLNMFRQYIIELWVGTGTALVLHARIQIPAFLICAACQCLHNQSFKPLLVFRMLIALRSELFCFSYHLIRWFNSIISIVVTFKVLRSLSLLLKSNIYCFVGLFLRLFIMAITRTYCTVQTMYELCWELKDV